MPPRSPRPYGLGEESSSSKVVRTMESASRASLITLQICTLQIEKEDSRVGCDSLAEWAPLVRDLDVDEAREICASSSAKPSSVKRSL